MATNSFTLTERQIYDALIQALENRIKRGDFDRQLPIGEHYIAGFLAACASLRLVRWSFYEICGRDADIERGWDINSDQVWQQARDKGLTDEQIDKELLEIELRVWQMMRDTLTPDK